MDVITGLIKANIPTRISFQVSSKIDSRTILDQMGAEALLGMGDMLYMPSGTGLPIRVHGAFVSDEEVHRVVAYLKEQGGEANYVEGVLDAAPADGEGGDAFGGGGEVSGEKDPLYDQAVEIVLKDRKASISYVQRKLKIGYNRARPPAGRHGKRRPGECPHQQRPARHHRALARRVTAPCNLSPADAFQAP